MVCRRLACVPVINNSKKLPVLNLYSYLRVRDANIGPQFIPRALARVSDQISRSEPEQESSNRENKFSGSHAEERIGFGALAASILVLWVAWNVASYSMILGSILFFYSLFGALCGLDLYSIGLMLIRAAN